VAENQERKVPWHFVWQKGGEGMGGGGKMRGRGRGEKKKDILGNLLNFAETLF